MADFDALKQSLKRAVAALRDAEIPYVVGGGFACWARGAPGSDHDVDIMVKEEDVGRAQRVLSLEGMHPEDPPEEWLLKVWDGDVLIDLIFKPIGLPIDDEVIARGEVRDVDAVQMRLMAVEDVLVTKLLALNEHYLDYAGLIEVTRALREQVDWDEVRERTAESPFARAFFTMTEGLQLVPPRGEAIAPDAPAAPVLRTVRE